MVVQDNFVESRTGIYGDGDDRCGGNVGIGASYDGDDWE